MLLLQKDRFYIKRKKSILVFGGKKGKDTLPSLAKAWRVIRMWLEARLT